MGHFDEMPSMMQLPVLIQVVSVLHHVGGYAAGLQPPLDLMRIQDSRPAVNHSVQLVAVCLASGKGIKARIGRELWCVHHCAQCTPVVLTAARDRNPSIGAGGCVDSMRGVIQVTVGNWLIA